MSVRLLVCPSICLFFCLYVCPSVCPSIRPSIHPSIRPWLAKRRVGGVSHARWLTTAIRILYVYMSMSEPSEAITRLATLVVSGYACWWFSSRVSWRITDAPNLYSAMKYVHELSPIEREPMKQVIERNFFWGHPEFILIARLASSNADIQSRAVARVIKSRETEVEVPVRVFHLPTPLYTASGFDSLIDWNELTITSPPLLRKLTNDDLRLRVSSPGKTQSVYIQTDLPICFTS